MSTAPTTLLLRDGKPIFGDALAVVVGDDASWPSDAQHRVTLERFVAHPGDASASVRLQPDDDVGRLAPYLSRLHAVDVDFPAFTDGRGYSQAKVLRDQLGFTGEIRATGDVGADQVHYLREVGCDAFELRAGTPKEAVVRALERITVNYRDPATRRGSGSA